MHHQRYPFRVLPSARLKLHLNCTAPPTRLSSSAVAEGVGRVVGSSSFALSVASNAGGGGGGGGGGVILWIL